MSLISILAQMTSARSASVGGGGSVSNIKNVKKIEDAAIYEAFGFVEKTGEDRLTYFCRRGSSHLVGGKPYYRHYTISTDTWSSAVQFDDDTLDFRDVWGGVMDNGDVILFTSTSANGSPTWDSNIFYRKLNPSTMTFGSRVQVAGGTTGVEKLQRGVVFGRLTQGAAAGEYFIMLVQWNVDTGVTRYKLSCLRTTDYFNTFVETTIYDGTTAYTEGCLVYIGNGKLSSIVRWNQGDKLYVFESSDNGDTWVYKGSSNLGWDTTSVKVPFLYKRSNGLVNFIYQDRDSGFINISKDNNVLTTFGTAFPNYTQPEIYTYNKTSSSSNPSLGYASQIEFSPGLFMTVWAKEEGANKANLWYTRDDLITDPLGLPDAPITISESFVTATSFRLDITGYTAAQWENIRYLKVDISTAPDFSTFVTAKYNEKTTVISLHDIIMPAGYINIKQVTSGTTYYVRIKAVNNAGSSGYTTKTVTTTA